MNIPARILRAHEQDSDPKAYTLTSRQQDRETRILAGAQRLFARFGPDNIAFRDLAVALRMATATLRFHFPDLDAVLGELIRRHLIDLARAIGDAPANAAARRAAYLAYTRTPWGGLTNAHQLLVRDRHLLPPDLLDPLDAAFQGLGRLVGGDRGIEALVLLDNPALDPERIEAYLAPPAAEPPSPPPPPLPAPAAKPARAPEPHYLEPPPDEKPGAWVQTLIENRALHPALD